RAALVAGAGLFGGHAARQVVDRLARRDPDVEDLPPRRPVALLVPAHEAAAQVRGVETVEQALDRTEQQRAVVRPGAARLAVGAVLAQVRHRLALERGPWAELDRHAERVADQRAPQPAQQAVPPRRYALFPLHDTP